jgi:serine/threonine protein kinase
VKPANVLLCTRGGMKDFVKVLDFGLVKQVDAKDPSLSSTDSIAGTPLYMAPESILEHRRAGGPLGGVGYWLLTGTPPDPGGAGVDPDALPREIA